MFPTVGRSGERSFLTTQYLQTVKAMDGMGQRSWGHYIHPAPGTLLQSSPTLYTDTRIHAHDTFSFSTFL